MKRLCLFCEHFCFSEEEKGYSEYTPGHPASLKCDKYYWNFSDIENFRLTMKLAESCSDFMASKDAEELGFTEE